MPRFSSKKARPPTPPRTDERGLPSGRNSTAAEIALLREVCADYPCVMFGILQIAAIMELHPRVITAVAAHPGSPLLRHTKKGRPEWVLEFLRHPPPDFET